MCVCDCNLNQLFCCLDNRPLGVKAIGFFYFILHFLCLIWPVYEINHYRGNTTAYENSTFVDIPLLQNGGYEHLLVLGIIFFLVGFVCNALMVWATTQVRKNGNF